jgi:hypothetical protein
MKQALKITLWAAGALLYAAIQVSAQQTTTQKPNSAAPEITDAQRAEFFKSQAEMIQSSAQAKEAQGKFQEAIAKMQQTCGEAYMLQMNPSGDPVCTVKTVPAKK